MCMHSSERGVKSENTRSFIGKNARDIQRLLTLQMNVLFLRTRSVQCSFTSFAWNLFHCEIILKSAQKFSSSMRKSASFHFQSFVCSACFASCCSISMSAICMWKKRVFPFSDCSMVPLPPPLRASHPTIDLPQFDFRFSLMMPRWHAYKALSHTHFAHSKIVSLRQSVTDIFIRISFIASDLLHFCLFSSPSICHCFRYSRFASIVLHGVCQFLFESAIGNANIRRRRTWRKWKNMQTFYCHLELSTRVELI